ncbi:MAG: D-tyrosyl-tRNA(Tyr) deacylase [Flavobacteriales bacterium]|nr:D-tyrosyl-tRNA(Tyr) deacylase [Flavobacteriales bacterium]
MKAVIQRVIKASVEINNKTVGAIDQGFMILLGITHDDTVEDLDYLIKKISQMRVFNDMDGKMNLSISEVDGSVLVVSQFTLHAKTKKGNRPSYIDAARPEVAIPLYEQFIESLKTELGSDKVATGEFGAMMQVHLVNDGPVTIIIDSKEKN